MTTALQRVLDVMDDPDLGVAETFEAARAAAKSGLLESLDAAWAEAEAALPEGHFLSVIKYTDGAGYGAWSWVDDPNDAEAFAPAPTPAAALRALAAKLREV